MYLSDTGQVIIPERKFVLGQDAGAVNAAGSQNTFIGRWAGFSNTGADFEYTRRIQLRESRHGGQQCVLWR